MSLSKKEQKASLRRENYFLNVQYQGLINKRENFTTILNGYVLGLDLFKEYKKDGIDSKRGQAKNLIRVSDMLVTNMNMSYPEKVNLIPMRLADRMNYLKESIKTIEGEINGLKESIEGNNDSIDKLGTMVGNIIRTMRTSRKGGRKSKRRSRKNKRKTMRKGGVFKPGASTAMATYIKEMKKSKKKENNKTVKDSKKKGESGFSLKLTKKMGSKFKEKK